MTGLYVWFQLIRPRRSARSPADDVRPWASRCTRMPRARRWTSRRAARHAGALKMLLVLLVCAAPVIASYFTYFVIRPRGPHQLQRADPAAATAAAGRALPLDRPAGRAGGPGLAARPVAAGRRGGGACDAACEKPLLLQRQLRETLGEERTGSTSSGSSPTPRPPRARSAAGHRQRHAGDGAARAARRRWRAGSRRRRARRSSSTCTSSIRWATG